MSAAAPERERVDPDVGAFPFEESEFEIVCDIAALRLSNGGGYPPCPGDPARWVAWRMTGCCGQGPAYRLVCDHCKKAYQRWMAHNACITCPYCNADVGGYARFTPLKGKS